MTAYQQPTGTTATEIPTVVPRRKGNMVVRWITTTDHKTIGYLYLITSFVFFCLGGVMALLIRAELFEPGMQVLVTKEQYNQMFTMHGTVMLLMFATPLFAGFTNVIMPLQIGAPDVAFPRLNALAYWFFLFGSTIAVSGFITPQGSASFGWTVYAPLNNTTFTPGIGGDLWVFGLALSGFGTILGAVNFITTIICMRAPGMTMWRMPIFTWNTLITSVLVLMAFPPLAAALFAVGADRRFGAHIYDPENGGALLFQHLFWFFGHPEVYIVALPAFGIVSDLISVHSRKAIFGYRMMVWAIVIIGALSFVVWAHHMFVSGMNPWFGFFFATSTLIIAVPTAIKVYNWVLTLWHGDIHLSVPMLFTLAFLLTFLAGGLTGLFLGNVSVDIPLSGTYFVVAHFHMVMGVAPLLVVFGAIYHWFPKITGRMLDDRIGRFHFWVTFLGTYAIYFPMHYLGVLGMPRRYYNWDGYQFIPPSAYTLNAFITVVAIGVGLTQLLFVYNLVHSAFRGQPAGPNPWRAASLEWFTPDTPPRHLNWGPQLPVVHRWAYAYSVPGAREDFIAQNAPAEDGGAEPVPYEGGREVPA